MSAITQTGKLHAIEASDAYGRDYEVFRDVPVADINQGVELGYIPPAQNFRNFPMDIQGFATSLLRMALAHTASGATVDCGVYLFPESFSRGRGDAPVKTRGEGLKIAEMVVTFAGGVVYGVCPYTRQAILREYKHGAYATFDNSTTRFYKASSVAFNDQYNTSVIQSLRTGTAAAANEVQTINLDSASGGTYTLTVTIGGVSATTGALAFDASDGTIQTALQGLANVGASNMTVSSLAITGAAALSAQELPRIILDKTLLTGGGGNATVARTTAGRSPEMLMMVDMMRFGSIYIEPTAFSAGSRVLIAGSPWQK